MHWHSFQEFIAMGGYGLYVWSSFGITFLLMGIEVIALIKRRQHASHTSK
jgi:heme exporter protein D